MFIRTFFFLLFRHVVRHGLLIMESLIPFEEVVNILDPVFTCMDTVHTGHGKRRHAHLQELVLVQEERFLAIQRHFSWSTRFFSNLFSKKCQYVAEKHVCERLVLPHDLPYLELNGGIWREQDRAERQ